MYTTISSKGQITIPVAIRNRLRLNTGDRIDFVVFEKDRVELVPKKGGRPRPQRHRQLFRQTNHARGNGCRNREWRRKAHPQQSPLISGRLSTGSSKALHHPLRCKSSAFFDRHFPPTTLIPSFHRFPPYRRFCGRTICTSRQPLLSFILLCTLNSETPNSQL